MADNWIDFSWKKPQESEGEHLVFDGEHILIAEWNNLCVCEMTQSPYKPDRNGKCPCGQWWNQCRQCQTLNNNYVSQKICGNSDEVKTCNWKFMVFGEGSCCESGKYYEIEVSHWMLLPNKPFNF